MFSFVRNLEIYNMFILREKINSFLSQFTMQKLLLRISFTAFNVLLFHCKSLYKLKILNTSFFLITVCSQNGFLGNCHNEKEKPLKLSSNYYLRWGHSVSSINNMLTLMIARFVTKDLTEQQVIVRTTNSYIERFWYFSVKIPNIGNVGYNTLSQRFSTFAVEGYSGKGLAGTKHRYTCVFSLHM